MQIDYDKDGNIKSASCNCVRGLVKCSHIAATYLHAIKHISRTDVPCTWKAQGGNIEHEPSETEQLFPDSKMYQCLTREPRAEDRSWLLSQLEACGNYTPMRWILAPEPQVKLAPNLPLILPLIRSLREEDGTFLEGIFREMVSCNYESIKSTAHLTVKQLSSASWHQVREGRLTASNFGAVLNASRVTPSLLKRILGKYKIQGTKACQWGITNEDLARQDFCTGWNVAVEETGIWLHDSGVLGASPDGLIGDDAVVEIKCPWATRDQPFHHFNSDEKSIINTDCNGNIIINVKHDWYHQIQGQMHLTGRREGYLVVWTRPSITVIKMTRHQDWAQNIDKLIQFFYKHMLPILVSIHSTSE